MADWHAIIEHAVERHPVAATLVRPGTPDVSASITVTAIQYQEQAEPSGGSAVQQTQRWLIPARRLAATTFPDPPRPGDYLVLAGLGTLRLTVVGPGMAGGQVVRYDVTGEGLAP